MFMQTKRRGGIINHYKKWSCWLDYFAVLHTHDARTHLEEIFSVYVELSIERNSSIECSL